MCELYFSSSRRRHTRYIGDWSSDVCSSDLVEKATGSVQMVKVVLVRLAPPEPHVGNLKIAPEVAGRVAVRLLVVRSEERRVGKGFGLRGAWEAFTRRAAVAGDDRCIMFIEP